MEKKKILKNVIKILVILVVILLVFFIINTIKNYVIITSLQDKISQYNNSSNYYMKSVATEENGTVVTVNYYKKNNKQVVFMERNLNGEISKISTYDNGERIDTFTETKDSKIAKLNSGSLISINIYNHLETDNKWQTFLGCISSKIKSTDYNGKNCYVVKGFMSSTSLTADGAESYIDKETGLLLKSIEEETIVEREYKFDKVEDSIFEEPDISQYTLK